MKIQFDLFLEPCTEYGECLATKHLVNAKNNRIRYKEWAL